LEPKIKRSCPRLKEGSINRTRRLKTRSILRREVRKERKKKIRRMMIMMRQMKTATVMISLPKKNQLINMAKLRMEIIRLSVRRNRRAKRREDSLLMELNDISTTLNIITSFIFFIDFIESETR